MSEVIGVLSGKGGVGKTTTVANLGAALSDEFDRNVVIVDTNLTTSHLGLHLGLYEDLPVTLREVVKKNMPISYAVYVHPPTGIRLVPASLSGEGVNLTSQKLKGIVKKLSHDYEFVIMDCPPGLGKEVVTSISAIDAALVVTTPDFPAVADALKTIDLLQKMRKRIIGVVVNKRRGQKYELSDREIESTCGARVIATIPDDARIPQGIAEGMPAVVFSPFSPASNAYKHLAAGLAGQEYRGGGIIDRLRSALSPHRREAPAPPAHQSPEAPRAQGASFVQVRRGQDDMSRSEMHDELKREIMQKLKDRMGEE